MDGQEIAVLKNSVYAYLLEGAIVIVLNVPLTIAMTVVQKIRSKREFQGDQVIPLQPRKTDPGFKAVLCGGHEITSGIGITASEQ
ncbi:unnamed protein product [Heligmosomoides polygyrus]|uniref:Uncharacterized protein n=1 Tax=Heligmosomoides polygyrus TaxID=6339 RepID=A0A183GM62_HELPZ|nr:unnamed protein product [Heligmosomoides polygyrus]